jgi:hypothetical protein
VAGERQLSIDHEYARSPLWRVGLAAAVAIVVVARVEVDERRFREVELARDGL